MTARALTALVLSTVIAAGLGFSATSRAVESCAGLAATIGGSDGPDLLIGTPSADVIVGGKGDDQIDGGGGADTICGGTGNDLILGDAGSDWLFGEDGDDALTGEAGNDVIDGGDGNDRVTYELSPGGVGVSLVGGSGTGAEGQDELRNLEALIGSPYDDTLVGSDGDEALVGTGGDDQLYGRSGSDLLAGGEGEDLLMGGAGVADVAMFSSEQAPVKADLEAESATVAGKQDKLLEIEGLLGGPFGDVLRGDSAENFISGGAGDDVMDGRGARDMLMYGIPRTDPGDPSQLITPGPAKINLQAGKGSDRSDQSEAAGDTLISFEAALGTDRDDRLIGTDRNDSLIGLGGDDVLDARGGDDALEGGTGSDVLMGGPGSDSGLWLLNPKPLNLDLGKRRAVSGRDRDRVVGIENAVGTPQNDLMRGDGGANLLVGMSGRDALYGRGGGDGLHGRGFAAGSEFGLGLGPKKDRILDGGPGRDGCEGKVQKNCERKRLNTAHAEILDRYLELIQDIKRRHGVRLRG